MFLRQQPVRQVYCLFSSPVYDFVLRVTWQDYGNRLQPVARPGGLEWGVVAGVWGRSPQRGPGAEPLVRGQGGEAPLKLKSFEPSEETGSWQICHPVKYCVNCSNILLEKVFVSPLP